MVQEDESLRSKVAQQRIIENALCDKIAQLTKVGTNLQDKLLTLVTNFIQGKRSSIGQD